MRQLGLILSLLLVVLGGRGLGAAAGPGSHCARAAAAGHHDGHANRAEHRPAANAVETVADCAHCPVDQCAASSGCAGGLSPQLVAPRATFVVRTGTAAVPGAPFARVRSTSTSPPTPPPQAIT
jgi:hypothetical protein